MDKDNDSELLCKIQEGDQAALIELMLRKDSMLYKFAKRFIKNENDAKSMVYEAFVKLRDNCHSIRDPNKLDAWLRAVVRNNVCNFLKRRKRELCVDDDTLEYLMNIRYTNEDNIVEKIAIRDCLAKLPADQLRVILLRYDGFTLTQIAAMMHKSVMQVRTLIHNARLNFKHELDLGGIE